MTQEQYEEVVMGLVGISGEGRGLAFEALRAARKKDFDLAEKTLKEARQTLLKAHEIQTDLIQGEINGSGVPITLLMLHAQDHLMTALLACELIEELIADKKENC